MTKAFHFVNSTGVVDDPAARRSLRRFVMSGKNSGKTLNRSSRLRLGERKSNEVRDYGFNTALENAQSAEQRDVAVSIDEPQSVFRNVTGDSYFSFNFPMRITKTELNIMNQWLEHVMVKIYPVRLNLALEDTKLSWLQILCSDKATCRCNFALMQAGNEIFLGDDGDAEKAAYSMSRTLRDVQFRMQSDKALDDSTIAIVLSLIMQEQIRGDYHTASVHLKGLWQIIELRGGMQQIEISPVLSLKIGMTDIVSSLQSGGLPRHFRDNMANVRDSLAVRAINLDAHLSESLFMPYSVHSALQSIWADCMNVSRLLKCHSCSQLDIWNFQEIELSICYRLLSFRPLGRKDEISKTSGACYIGLVIFICTMFLQYDNRRIINFPLISFHARASLTSHLNDLDPELAFWLAVITSLWVSAESDSQWLFPVLRKTANYLQVVTYDHALKHLEKFPWVPSIHDPPARTAWNSFFEEPTSGSREVSEKEW